MIPARFLPAKDRPPTGDAPEPTTLVTLTIKKPDPKLPNGIEFPEAPKTVGKVTETITKSLLTETVVTRVTDNKLVAPVIIEVSHILFVLLTKHRPVCVLTSFFN